MNNDAGAHAGYYSEVHDQPPAFPCLRSFQHTFRLQVGMHLPSRNSRKCVRPDMATDSHLTMKAGIATLPGLLS